MGISIYSNSGKINYGIKHLILDTQKDLQQLTNQYIAGTTVYITQTKETYILNNQKQWVKMGGNTSTPDTPELVPAPNNNS